jgi:hypothetical protein
MLDSRDMAAGLFGKFIERGREF